jgi:hypothetical protein
LIICGSCTGSLAAHAEVIPDSRGEIGVDSLLKSVILPLSVKRTVLFKEVSWQGVGLELEHLNSPALLMVILEQLASILPGLTPVWSEHGVVKTQWATNQASYSMLLWQTKEGETEGIFSGLPLNRPELEQERVKDERFSLREWLPASAERLFTFTDRSTDGVIALSSFVIPLMPAQVVEYIKYQGKKYDWIRMENELEFFRQSKRVSFYIKADNGISTVLAYQTLIDTK